MRIHVSENVTSAVIYAAAGYAARTAGHGSVYVESATRHGSRKAHHAHELALSGDGTATKRRRNPGTGGRDNNHRDDYSATYDSWGHALAYLYAIDASMSCYAYADAQDFANKTHGAYPLPRIDEAGRPTTDTHGRIGARAFVGCENHQHDKTA